MTRENEELQRLEHLPPFWKNPSPKTKKLSKQLSMCETTLTRDMAWERRRRQFLHQERRRLYGDGGNINNDLTDEDLSELKGCIDLGFGFNEEQGQELCLTIPALDLYFAVNREISPSPTSSNGGSSNNVMHRSSSFGGRLSDSDSWKICSPGDDPEQVKTKLRHWAQAVACSVRQSY